MKLSDYKTYFGDRKFYKDMFAIALPIALQSLITIGVNLIDNIMLGSLGEIALSASTLAVQFITFYHICCMGLGMGASVLVSRFWGMKDIISLKKVVTLMLRFTIVIGLVFTLAAALIPKGIMGLYSEEMPVINEGMRYLKWSVPCFLMMGLTTTTTIVLRSVDQTRIPIGVLCGILLIFLRTVFIW